MNPIAGVFLDVDNGRLQGGEIMKLCKKLRKHAANLVNTTKNEFFLVVVMEHTNHTFLAIIEHDLVEILTSKCLEMVVPCCCNTAGGAFRHDGIGSIAMIVGMGMGMGMEMEMETAVFLVSSNDLRNESTSHPSCEVE